MTLQRKKPWIRVSAKKEERHHQDNLQWNKDRQFYTRIWEQRRGQCEITRQPLGDQPLTTMFHHLLPKAKYPQFRYCEWNIVLLHPDLHASVERDMDKVPQIRARYEALKEKLLDGVLSECGCS